MKIEEIRRRNLSVLASEFSTIAALAEAADTNESYLSTILSGSRNAGTKLSRKLEKAANRKPGWMDKDHEAKAEQTGLSRIEQELIHLFRSASAERRRLILALARMKV